ncbi:hypothetical protein [Novacetimonas pomaceti]|uniref:DUF3325 domain-containing protein n=1 Tax=Novacetimonas pomaceti TaxID=2021998 RepID=A0ABX5P7D7_9PROT|nr:hypothetical protein [Novacetimonas pomaceti]PYD49109.1 hypothetical protein C3920_01105 [Novacetimonas pomaceti]
MTILISLLSWTIALSCHAWLQPARYHLPPVSRTIQVAMRVARAIAPMLALGVALTAGPVAGVLVWCATFSIAGMAVAIVVERLAHH